MTAFANTPFGLYRGLQRDDIQTFRGIRFATSQRFQHPVLVPAHHDEFDATSFGPQCPQFPGLMEQAFGSSSMAMDEDCLRLNIVTPRCDDRQRPVLVWIHGGAFTTGAGSIPWYDGAHLVRHGDVVVVTINYRLGALGFAGPDNWGLADQVVALQWIQQSISSFGGDPSNVTIFGESAGGASVVTLMATPSAAGLFARGIAMSPSLGQLRSRHTADTALVRFLDLAGSASLDELRDAPLDRILTAQGEVLSSGGAGLTDFAPCSDGHLIPSPIAQAAAANPKPLVVGTTRDEMRLFNAFNPAMADPSDEQILAMLDGYLNGQSTHALAVYRSVMPDASNYELFCAAQTDAVFRAPMWDLVNGRIAAGSPTWVYWFTWRTPVFDGRLGACHAIDVPFTFHTLDRNGVEMFTGTGTDRIAVADALSGAVLGFAATGQASWPTYHDATRAVQRFDEHSEILLDPDASLRLLWANTSMALLGMP